MGWLKMPNLYDKTINCSLFIINLFNWSVVSVTVLHVIIIVYLCYSSSYKIINYLL